MKTKKLLLVFALTLFVSSINAQNIKLAVQAGANFTSMSKKVSSELENDIILYYDYKPGFKLGILAEYELKNGLALQSGLFYTQKGFNKDLKKFEDVINDNESDDVSVSGKWWNRYNYLEIPIHLVYNIDDFSIFAGPYLAYGIGGKAFLDLTFKDNENGDTETYDEEVDIKAVGGEVDEDEFFSEDVWSVVVYKKFDAGIDLGVGYKYEKFLLQAQYSMGLININPTISDFDDFDMDKDFNLKNKGFSLTLSYFFK